ncbi:MAG: radical SAM protein [Chloroflexi bacterium]|nr:radical SAM protein [Chloroflexota bacterium]
MVTSSRSKRVIIVAPKSTGGNFEYVAIPRQGPLYLSGALGQWHGDYLYEREVWYEDRCGHIDPDKDLEKADILLVTALINEAPRAYQIAREARQHHPNLPIIGGGPHMSPLADEALRFTGMDAVVQREGEDVIGPLCDLMLSYDGAERTAQLRKFPGIAFLDESHYVENARHGVIPPNYVELPDFASVKDLTPANPLAAGIIETVRGCTEKCTYCQVIQQFLGYRMVPRETELRRLAQLHKLAEDGLIYAARDGRFSVFVSDDLHPPPLRAVKYRDERLARLRNWKGHTEGMWMICQTRAEIGQDPELAEAMVEAGFKMLYVGVESSNAKNLALVKKRQDPDQVHKDLTKLNELGFILCAMTIIGLPYDTDESIMEMARWVRTVSRYQTANWLTPLPATVNWHGLAPVDEDGSILPPGKMRPYHLYTGRQLVHRDERWSLQESRDLFARYTRELRPVDALYERIFRMFRSKAYYETMGRRQAEEAPASAVARLAASVSTRTASAGANLTAALARMSEGVSLKLNEAEKTLSAGIADIASHAQVSWPTEWRESLAARVRGLQETASTKLAELRATVTANVTEARALAVTATGDARDAWSSRLEELGHTLSSKAREVREALLLRLKQVRDSVATLRGDPHRSLTAKVGEVQEAFARRLDEVGEAMAALVADLRATLEDPAPARQRTTPSPS